MMRRRTSCWNKNQGKTVSHRGEEDSVLSFSSFEFSQDDQPNKSKSLLNLRTYLSTRPSNVFSSGLSSPFWSDELSTRGTVFRWEFPWLDVDRRSFSVEIPWRYWSSNMKSLDSCQSQTSNLYSTLIIEHIHWQIATFDHRRGYSLQTFTMTTIELLVYLWVKSKRKLWPRWKTTIMIGTLHPHRTRRDKRFEMIMSDGTDCGSATLTVISRQYDSTRWSTFLDFVRELINLPTSREMTRWFLLRWWRVDTRRKNKNCQRKNSGIHCVHIFEKWTWARHDERFAFHTHRLENRTRLFVP